MKAAIKVILMGSAVLLLTACQQLNTELTKLNSGLSQINGTETAQPAQSAPSGGKISNQWGVTADQAMNWLEHNETTWDDNGKLSGVNWLDFWSAEISAKTSLSAKAYMYCHVSGAETRQVGANCQRYWQAYSMTMSDKSRDYGNKVEQLV